MIKFLGVSIIDASSQEMLMQSKNPLFIVTLNPEILLHAWKNSSYRSIINSADVRTIDGVGIVIMARLLYGIILKRLTGVELAEQLITQAKNDNHRVLLVGGTADANNRAANRLGITGFGGKFFWEEAYEQIIRQKPHVLLVAMGAPKQEEFIHRLFTTYPQKKLPSIAMGVGGAVDFWAQPRLRAPHILRKIGFEWAWRVLRQPWRVARIVKAVIVFPLACLIERMLLK